MKVKSRVTMVLVVMGVVMGMVVPGISQEKPADNMQIVLEKVRADKKLLVSENMQLTEAEAKAFWPVYDQYQDELFLLRTRTVKLIKDFADAYEKMTNETAKKLMDEYITIETSGAEASSGLSPEVSQSLARGKGRALLPDREQDSGSAVL